MPPLTPEQTTAIQNANQNATVNADAILTPPATPNLPATRPPEPPTVPQDIMQFVTPPPQADNTQLEQQTSSVFEQLLGAQDQAATQGARLTALEQQAGIPTMSLELSNLNTTIRQKALDFKREQEAIQNETLTAAQKNARLADVSRKQAAQMADYEVARAALTGSLNAIQSIIDRKVQREFADEGRRIENLKFIYDQRKGDLTKAQDRQYQQMITREERAFNLAKSKFEQVENAKAAAIQSIAGSNAPNSVYEKIMKAKDIGEATKIAAPYSDAYLKRQLLSSQISEQKAKTEKAKKDLTEKPGINQETLTKAIESKIGTKALATKNLIAQLQIVKDLYSQYGARPRNPDQLAAVNAARENASLAIAEAFGQGAIQDGDRRSYEKLVGTTFGIAPTAAIEQSISAQEQNYKNQTAVLESAYPGISNVEIFKYEKLNKFKQATGQTEEEIPGTSIVSGFSSDGSINFNIPVTKQK